MPAHSGSPTQIIGQHYESMAEQYLLQQGLIPLVRNFTCPMGELDIIMRDRDYLVFVEVRYRLARGYGQAVESISKSKQRKLVLSAQAFLANNPRFRHWPCRFDVIAIDKTADGSLTLNWITNAITG